jgi:hypothetical protein
VKQQVQILKRSEDDLKTTVHMPTEDPRGMGYSGIVTSDMFGLDAALDKVTFKLIEEKRKLLAAKEPSESQLKRVDKINEQLEGLGFRYETRDPVYTEYLKAKYDFETSQIADVPPVWLTPEEEREKAKRLVERALSKSIGENS